MFIYNNIERSVIILIIGAKSALLLSQLEDRHQRGVKHIEVQTLLPDFDHLDESMKKERWFSELQLNVYALHAPMQNSFGKECYVGEANTVWRKENMHLIKKSALLLDRLSQFEHPILIIHSGALISKTENEQRFVKERKKIFMNDVAEIAEFAKQKTPRITIVMENNPKLADFHGIERHFGYGYEDDIAKWVKELRLSNVGTVLDTCHAIGAINYNIDQHRDTDFVDIDAYVHAYSSTLRLLHISNGHRYVASRNEHGLPFDPEKQEDVNWMKHFLQTLTEIQYRHPITIETEEVSYNEALNFSKTLNTLLMAIQQ